VNDPDRQWIPQRRDREISIGLVLLGALVTVIAFFFAGIAGMAYRNSWIQDWAIILMGFGPPLIYLVTLIVTVRLIRARRRSWHTALASCLAPIGIWFLGLGIAILSVTRIIG
jgi:hypothetical protein